VYEQYLPNYDSSIFYYKKALDAFSESEDESGVATALGNIGIIFWLQHQADSAIFYAKKALKIRKSINDEEGISSSIFNLGRSYAENKNYKKAEEFYQQSLQISRQINSRKRISETYEAMAILYHEINLSEKAYSYHLKYSQLRDSLLNEENDKHIAKLKTLYDLEKKDKKLNVLAHQNQLQKERITRYNYGLVAIFLIVSLVTLVAFLLLRQNRLKLQQQALELQQKLLRSQMNPHFIFNTLSSIQTYMLENDTKSASRFLSGFAKLMRHILENSKHEFISLEDEIEFLNNYLHIQQLRFTKSFNYKVVYREEEEPSQILVPPMLSQPFVENAIEHGIRNIDWTGEINILITSNEKNLQISIEDNGVGFNHKKEKKPISQNHKSTGIENARQRIQILTNKYSSDHIFKITDMSYENPEGKGTIVTFAIPIIYA